jgi:hypothetical protein
MNSGAAVAAELTKHEHQLYRFPTPPAGGVQRLCGMCGVLGQVLVWGMLVVAVRAPTHGRVDEG